MDLLRRRIQIREIGFLPSKIDRDGFATSWSFSEKLRSHNKMRIGVVEYIGQECQEVQKGMVVLYNTIHAVPSKMTNVKNVFEIHETNCVGKYTGIEETNKGLVMDKLTFHPLSDRVVIKKDAAPVAKKEKNGLIAPDTQVSPTAKGTVVACGPGDGAIKMAVKPGNKIMFGANTGITIDLEEGQFLLMREADVYGIFK